MFVNQDLHLSFVCHIRTGIEHTQTFHLFVACTGGTVLVRPVQSYVFDSRSTRDMQVCNRHHLTHVLVSCCLSSNMRLHVHVLYSGPFADVTCAERGGHESSVL